MTIKIGDKLPDGEFAFVGEDGPQKVSAAEIFDDKKIVLFGLPGAFTPTCHRNHLPGFLENAEMIKARGIDEIVLLSVNDQWVMKAWAEISKAEGKIRFLADGNADYARALGLEADMSAAGFGTRLKRFSMIVDDGVVKSLNIEDAPGKAEISGAAAIIKQL